MMLNSRTCIDCGVEATVENTGVYKDKDKPEVKRFNSRCKCCTAERTRAWKQKNPDKKRLANQRWTNNNKDKANQSIRNWNKANPTKRANTLAIYRARKKDQTCPLTPVEQEWLQFYYDESARLTEETGIQHEVDHIKPIAKGGLHAPWNLQVLTMEENRSKGAKWLSEAA